MKEPQGSKYVYPFLLGTAFGALGGATVGVLLGRRAFAALMHVVSLLTRRNNDELRFDLLLQ